MRDLPALVAALPELTHLHLQTLSGSLTQSCLVGLVEGLLCLQKLELDLRVSSPSDVVQAALAAQQQAHAGHRTQPVVIKLGRWALWKGAEAVNAELQPLLGQGLWGPPMVQVV